MPAPQISPLPNPPSRSQSPETFSADADAFLGALPEFQTDANAQADYLDALAIAVDADAAAADADAASALASKNAALASQTAAAISAAAALVSENAAAASFDSFDDRYLGAKASNPSVDNDGGALLTGALYFNTTSNQMRVYNGSVWETAYLPASAYVQGPASATDGALVAFDGTTGKLIKQNGNVTVAQGGTGATTLTGYVKGAGTSALTASASIPVDDISGTLPVSKGGTGATTLTANNVLLGNGTSALQSIAPSTTGNVLTSNGTSWISAAASGVISNYQEFLSSGTWTKPAGATWVYVEAIGGGGSGANRFGNDTGAAGGGGGGGWNGELFRASDLTSTVAVTVGAGGTRVGGVGGGINGNAGGDTSFGAYTTARGGSGGVHNTPASNATGGASGSGVLGTGTVGTAGYNGSSGGGGNSGSGGFTTKGGAGGGSAGGGGINAGGISLDGGNGGAGNTSFEGIAPSGSVPGGGGGGKYYGWTNGLSGAGASGSVRIWAW